MHHNASDGEFKSKTTTDSKAIPNKPIDMKLYKEGENIVELHFKWRRQDPYNKYINNELDALILKATGEDKSKAITLRNTLDNLYKTIECYRKDMDKFEKNIDGKKKDITIYSKPYLEARELYIQALEKLQSLGLPNDIRLGILNNAQDGLFTGLMRTPLLQRDTKMVSTLLVNGINPLKALSQLSNLILLYGGGVYSLERFHKCVELILSYTIDFINNENLDDFIRIIKDMLAGGAGIEQINQGNYNSYEFSTALAFWIKKKNIPIEYQVKLLESINIDEQPPLWSIPKELEGKFIPAKSDSELRDRSLIKHIYMITRDFLYGMHYLADSKRLTPIIEKNGDWLKEVIFEGKWFDELKEFKVNTDLLMNLKNFINEAQYLTMNPKNKLYAFIEELFHKSSPQPIQNMWDTFVKRNEDVLNEFNALLVRKGLEPINSISTITSDSTSTKIAKK